jgi:hypothetical protein
METGKILFLLILLSASLSAQEKGLLNTQKSRYVQMHNVDMDAVHWTGGFWADRFEVYRDTMIWNMWKTLNNPDLSHSFRNFEIAAGLEEGTHQGPPFHDGDFYKWFEGAAALYAVTRDLRLDALMDRIIDIFGSVQRSDGYIHTPAIIEAKNSGREIAFNDRLNFETYNLGHFMTAACVHYRATGKRKMLDMAVKAADFLIHFYKTASAELARNAICPSHYMGVVEMYRTTGNKAYLELANNLIDIRGMVENGTDDNQDRIPFREQKEAMGHAVRANYLYAGVADLYAETGEAQLKENLESIWQDIVHRKMYITGACGALYDGVSPDGTSYDPDSIQKVHQAYGRAYQLPHSTAHNETCANIGNILFNWRMLQISGEERYAAVMETALYNSILSGVSIDGKRFFYTNPLRVSDEFPYTLRWSKEREEYIQLCNCCPPNTVRTLCEVHNYLYSVGEEEIWFHTYGGNRLETTLPNGEPICLTQESDYPWDGNIRIRVEQAPRGDSLTFHLRIPAWCHNATLSVNGETAPVALEAGSYATLKRTWKGGDQVELHLPMQPVLMEANPLVEEARNQVAVMRGPLVYCLESVDLPNGCDIDDILLQVGIRLTPSKIMIEGSPVVALEGEADLLVSDHSWENQLYRPVGKEKRKVQIRLIPYYAWGNRGKGEMTVWLPLTRS